MPTWNDSMPGMPPPAQQGENTAQILESILGKNSTDLTKLAEKAATPIAGGHATNLPLSMDPTPRQNQPGQLDHREVVGAGNARAQGIGNSVIGVMNAVSGAKTALDNRKRLEVASATQQLLTAQSAMDQAKQILQNDPNNTNAKEAIKHNTDIMNGILSNDKTRSAIAKGFNIDFTNPEANKTPDHAAVQQGINMAKKSASYAEQFNQKTPTVMAPNQQAQAQYAAAIQEQKYKTEMMRAMVPLISTQVHEGGALTREQMKEHAATALQYVKSQDAWAKLNADLQGRAQLQKNAYTYRMAEIGAEGSKQIQVFKAELEAKDNDSTSLMKSYQNFDQKSAATLSKLQNDIATNMQKKIQLAQTGADPGSLQTIDYAIQQGKAALASFQNTVKSSKDYFSLRLTGKPYDAGNSSNTNSSSKLGAASTFNFSTDPDEESEAEENLWNPTIY